MDEHSLPSSADNSGETPHGQSRSWSIGAVPPPGQDERPRLGRSLPKSDRVVTLASMTIAIVAALAALWAGYEAHKTRIEDERPFIRSEFVGVTREVVEVSAEDVEDDKKVLQAGVFTPHVKFIVFGKTPAVNIILQSDCFPTFANEKHYVRQISSASNSGIYEVIFPEESKEIFCHKKILDQTKDGYPRGLAEFSGVLFYEDLDGHQYQTPFCYLWLNGDAIAKIPDTVTECYSWDKPK